MEIHTSIPCPTLFEEETKLELYQPKEIDQNERLANEFISTVNLAYRYVGEKTKMINNHDRLEKGCLLEKQLGKNDPSTFCILFSKRRRKNESEQEFEMVATVTARLYAIDNLPITRESLLQEKDQGILTPVAIFTRLKIPHQKFTIQNSIFWVVNSLAVHPSMQGKRIGSWLMDVAEEEIIQRTKKIIQSKTSQPSSVQTINKLVIILTACPEQAGTLYTKKGYLIDDQDQYPPNTIGSTLGFTIVQMYKEFDL